MNGGRRPPLLIGLALAALSGVLYFLGFVGFGLYPLIFFFLVPVLIAIRGATPGRALALGVAAGFAANLGGYYWVVHLLQAFAGSSLPLALLGYALLALYHGLLIGIVMWVVRRLEHAGVASPFVSLPVAFASLELVYPFLFPSFISNSLYRATALTQIVELFGMPGLSAVVCLVNAAIYELVRARLDGVRSDPRRLLIAAAVFSGAIAYGLVRVPMIERRIAEAPKLRVAMIQTNLGARDKEGRKDAFIRRHREMSKEAIRTHAPLDLIVWPESAFNRWIPKGTKNLDAVVTQGLGVPVLFGALTFEDGPSARSRATRKIYNTAVLTSSTGDVLGEFDKVKLLAFGETIPLVETFPRIKEWFPRSSTFTRGTRFSHLRLGDTRILPMICYEDIIPTFVRALWDADGPPHVLVNVTNDSWYGDTHEPLIHLALATFRSIETRRAMIRSTNTGISAFVDPLGRITKRSAQWTQEAIVGEVPLLTDGATPLYMWIGDLPSYAGIAWVLASLLRARRAGRRTR